MPGKAKNRYLIPIAISTAGAGCCAYYFYNTEYFREQRRRWEKFFRSLSALSEALSSTGNISRVVSRDLHEFLQSDSDEVPQSLRQLLKLTHCPEFQSTVIRFSGSFTEGVVRGISATADAIRFPSFSTQGETQPNESSLRLDVRSLQTASSSSFAENLPEKLLDKVFSDAGQGFVSAVVGKAVRTLVETYFEKASQGAGELGSGTEQDEGGVDENVRRRRPSRSQTSSVLDLCLEVACTRKGKEVLSVVVSTFASNAVSAFLDNTPDVNVFEDIASTLTKEEYKEPMTDILKSVCGEGVEKFVRTSHDVFTASARQAREAGEEDAFTAAVRSSLPPGIPCEDDGGHGSPLSVTPVHMERGSSSSSGGESPLGATPPHATSPHRPSSSAAGAHGSLQLAVRRLAERRADAPGSASRPAESWRDEVGKLLSNPDNRQLILEMAGAMSSNGVRALTNQAMESLRSMGLGTVPRPTVDASGRLLSPRVSSGPLGPLKAVAGRALTASSVCLALCLYVVTGQSIGQPGMVISRIAP
eukprot:TRINITY_DN20387_c0_g1_i1.p1 TRINITY_DN20387_c0_g1~~TRINITY_DN20387_c0_g1_i1.p1  ORF type:complete len:532 (+),score=58.26 TRINITY_DN20387_c0_g1_i1:241-1836(+)